ncbi:hypothetical protein CDAR_535641 [Caerostris darwini]|uniref:Uncharacterized protein n=1 Tax=Caerostris darwini TaxID=1538125 RepID=A0AAV4QMU2_9ARAC|nr:hypothetical protein CDAR_535641 [Caerostris darwini]
MARKNPFPAFISDSSVVIRRRGVTSGAISCRGYPAERMRGTWRMRARWPGQMEPSAAERVRSDSEPERMSRQRGLLKHPHQWRTSFFPFFNYFNNLTTIS